MRVISLGNIGSPFAGPEIPMCWKCRDAVTIPQNNGSQMLVGCEACDKVKDYTTAQKHCPLIRKGTCDTD